MKISKLLSKEQAYIFKTIDRNSYFALREEWYEALDIFMESAIDRLL